MKIVLAFVMLLVGAVSGSLRGNTGGRDLQSFDVDITEVDGQTIKFNTGNGMGTGVSVKVKVTNLCRTESANRVTEGYLFPDNSVPGIIADNSGVKNPGPGSVLSFKFAEGIAANSDIYKTNMPGSATVTFCVEVGLFAGTGADEMQVNFKEVKVTYNLNLFANVADLTAHDP